MDKYFVSKYLKRISYEGGVNKDITTLKKIQKQHLLRVPFENLDMFYDKKISLNREALFKKIVLQNRGGICYELNGLLFYLLKNIGFEVNYLSANVDGNDFDHILIMALVGNEKYLVDVGFGNHFIEPIKFVLDVEQVDLNGRFKIIHDKLNRYQLYKSNSLEYTFILQERVLQDFSNRCSYFESADESIFRKNPLCSLEKEHGRISLTDQRLKITEFDKQSESTIKSEREFKHILNDVFKIKIKEKHF